MIYCSKGIKHRVHIMGFIESYKHLEKLCGEVLNDDRRISANIDEMQSTPRGALYVSSWDEDLEMLKHYRWVRNQIVHEVGCTEQNMCDPEAAPWLDDFYSRIMNESDPLTLYRKATTPSSNFRPTQSHAQESSDRTMLHPRTSPQKAIGCLTSCAVIFVLIAVTLLLMSI